VHVSRGCLETLHRMRARPAGKMARISSEVGQFQRDMQRPCMTITEMRQTACQHGLPFSHAPPLTITFLGGTLSPAYRGPIKLIFSLRVAQLANAVRNVMADAWPDD